MYMLEEFRKKRGTNKFGASSRKRQQKSVCDMEQVKRSKLKENILKGLGWRHGKQIKNKPEASMDEWFSYVCSPPELLSTEKERGWKQKEAELWPQPGSPTYCAVTRFFFRQCKKKKNLCTCTGFPFTSTLAFPWSSTMVIWLLLAARHPLNSSLFSPHTLSIL